MRGGRRSWARKQLGVSHELGRRTWAWGGGPGVTVSQSHPSEVFSWTPHPTQAPRKPALAPPPAKPASWHTAESSDLTTAKITFPGKRFHLLKRILRKYCTQQWISDLFCSRWIFLSANKQVHQLMVWQAEFLKNIWLEHNEYSKMYYQNKCIYRQIKLEFLSLKLGWRG